MKIGMPFAVAGGLLGMFSLAGAEQIAKPHTFTAGTPAQAEQVNADFDTVYGQVNKVGAAITVDGAGNVGIGTATPVGELHVNKAPVVSAITYTGGAGGNNLVVDASHYTGSGSSSHLVRVINGVPAVDAIIFSLDGGLSWSNFMDMSAEGIALPDGVVIRFTAVDGHYVGDQWSWTVTAGIPDGLVVSNGKVTVKQLAISGGAAAGQILTSDAAGNASWQPAAPDADNDPFNELQYLDRKGNIVTLSPYGGEVSIADDDSDPTNEIQTITRTGTDITLSKGGGTVSIADNDDNQFNELQALSLVGNNLTLSLGGGTVSINEYNTGVAMSGTTLQVSDEGGVKSVDLAEQLSLGSLADAKDDGSSLFLGSGAGAFDGGGNGNMALGINALSQNYSGQANVAVGNLALRQNSAGVGNVALGSSAGFLNETGSANTFLGHNAGYSNVAGSGNVFLGYSAGYYETGGNKLYVTNGKDTTPLLYGDFATDALTVNGTLATTGNTRVGGVMAVGSGATVSPDTTFKVVGGATESRTGSFYNQSTGYMAYGLSGAALGVSSRVNEYRNGVYGSATGGYTNQGVQGLADDNLANQNRGVVGYAYGGVNAYGVYGYAQGGTTGNYAGYFDGDVRVIGSLQYGGALIQPSDKRLKENIRPLANGLAKVAAINGVYYNLKTNPGQTEVGVIAQDVQAVLPEAVSVIDKENGYLGVSYTSLVPVLIEAVKELQAANDTKDAKIAALLALACQDHPEAAVCGEK